MFIVPPNFVSVRLTDEDKENYKRLLEASEKQQRVRMSTADLYRYAMEALAEKLKVKVY